MILKLSTRYLPSIEYLGTAAELLNSTGQFPHDGEIHEEEHECHNKEAYGEDVVGQRTTDQPPGVDPIPHSLVT